MVAVVVLLDHVGDIFFVFAKNLPVLDISADEASAALLAVEVAASFSSSKILLEGDSSSVMTAINNSNLCAESAYWSIAPIVEDVMDSHSSC